MLFYLMQPRGKANEHGTFKCPTLALRSLVMIGPEVPQVGDLLWSASFLPAPVVVRAVEPLTRRDGCGSDPVLVLVA